MSSTSQQTPDQKDAELAALRSELSKVRQATESTAKTSWMVRQILMTPALLIAVVVIWLLVSFLRDFWGGRMHF
jgi:hypothetical protein